MTPHRHHRMNALASRHALTLALLVFVVLLACAATVASCHPRSRAQTKSGAVPQGNVDLNEPAPEPPSQGPGLGDIAHMTTEELWVSRCSQCHKKELGLDKYKGREWHPIIARMMKKPLSHINAAIARELYVYLYKKTAGEEPPDIEEYENAPVSSAGETFGGD